MDRSYTRVQRARVCRADVRLGRAREEPVDAERVVRTANEMAEEAKQLRALLDASK